MDLFAKSSRWKHRNLGLVVHILEKDEDKFLLAYVNWEDNADPCLKGLLSGRWTALDLVRDFTPVIEPTRWDVLSSGASLLR